MAFNLGAFAGGMSQGMNSGMELGGKIKKVREQNQDREFAESTAAEARDGRERSISGLIQTNTRDVDGIPQTSYTVGGQTFADQGAARRAAEGQVGSFADYYRQTAMPQILDRFVQQGRHEDAARFQAFMDASETHANMRNWQGMIRAAQAGDDAAFGRAFQRTYNGWGSGINVTGTRALRDNDGNFTGMEVSYRAPGSDEVRRQTFNGDMAQIFRMGVGAVAPENAFEFAGQQITTQDQARAQAGHDARTEARQDERDERTYQRQIALDDRKAQREADRDAQRQRYTLEEQGNASSLRQAEAQGRPPTSAELRGTRQERITRMLGTLGQNPNPRWDRMSAAEKVAEATRMVDEIERASGGVSTPAAPAGRGVGAQPPAQGRQMPSMY